MTAKPTPADCRNFLSDAISWKSLYAVQQGAYESREAIIADAIKWCSQIDAALVAKLLVQP